MDTKAIISRLRGVAPAAGFKSETTKPKPSNNKAKRGHNAEQTISSVAKAKQN
jgi:hypothetical protein